VNGLWTAVAIVSVAAAAHQWWSANIFTLATDMFPRRAIGSVVGIGGFFGAMGGFVFQLPRARCSRPTATTTRRSSWRAGSPTSRRCS
jgi:nitrate/nitrite transporter NarK